MLRVRDCLESNITEMSQKSIVVFLIESVHESRVQAILKLLKQTDTDYVFQTRSSFSKSELKQHLNVSQFIFVTSVTSDSEAEPPSNLEHFGALPLANKCDDTSLVVLVPHVGLAGEDVCCSMNELTYALCRYASHLRKNPSTMFDRAAERKKYDCHYFTDKSLVKRLLK